MKHIKNWLCILKNISKYFEIVPIIDPFGTEIEWENTVHLKKSEHF